MRAVRWLFVISLLSMAVLLWQNPQWLDLLVVPQPNAVEAQADATAASALAIESFHLSNGMQVIMLPNHRVPALTHMLWLRVGAADDPQGKSGLAHYHEHLMFKGTPTVAEGEYSKRLEALGAQFNAFTGADFTGYYVNAAAEHLETIMQLESDRFQHLQPAAHDYAKELEVIVEERQSRVDNSPAAQWQEQMQAALFLHHPYRIPIIGWMHEIKGLTPKDATEFYRSHYHAGNMVLVVAGDITRDRLEPLAEKYYGALLAHTPNARAWVQEPQPKASRHVRFVHPEVTQPRFQRRYSTASYGTATSDEVMALSLLSQWLGGGQTSFLHEQLVQKEKLAVSVSANYSGLSRGPAQFSIAAVPAPSVSLEQLEEAIDRLLAQAKTQLVTKETLTRIQTLYLADAIYARDSLSALAHYAGYLAMLELPQSYLTHWQEHVQAVTSAHMQQAANTWLVPERSVTGYLLPAPQAKAAIHD